MIRASIVLPLLLLFSFITPRPAHAGLGAILDYLESLSGPGPFWGATVGYSVHCRPQLPKPSPVEADSPGKTPVAGNLGFGCTGDMRKHRHVYGLMTGVYRTFNDRPDSYVYEDSRKHTAAGLREAPVWAFPLTVTADYSLAMEDAGEVAQVALRTFDLGATAGAILFKGEGFDAFLRPYVELPRLTIRPFSYRACRSGCPAGPTSADRFQIEVFLRYVGAVSAQQFGAVAGPASGSHLQRGIRVGYSWQRH